jgi:protein-tyrosine kinase
MSRIEKAMEKAMEGTGALPIPGQPQVSSVNEAVSDKIQSANRRLVAANQYNLPIAEEYRKLKSLIVQITKKNPEQNLLLVTSSIGGEGKSLTALNLAISLAQEHNRKVLIIDTDLRKPSIGNYLGLNPQQGLTDCLNGSADLEKVLIKTEFENLTFLPAGITRINPVELFSSPKMKNLLAQLKESFRDGYVVIDSSPALPFAEARILSGLADSVVYIVKEGGTSLKNIQDGLNSLYEANVIGIVYNRATTAGLAGGYHYYYYGYDYRSGIKNEPPKRAVKTGGFLSLFRKSKPGSPSGKSGHV